MNEELIERGALRVIPEMLHLIPALLPGTIRIAGTFAFPAESDGTVWLAIDGPGIRSGAHYVIEVQDAGFIRTATLTEKRRGQ